MLTERHDEDGVGVPQRRPGSRPAARLPRARPARRQVGLPGAQGGSVGAQQREGPPHLGAAESLGELLPPIDPTDLPKARRTPCVSCAKVAPDTGAALSHAGRTPSAAPCQRPANGSLNFRSCDSPAHSSFADLFLAFHDSLCICKRCHLSALLP